MIWLIALIPLAAVTSVIAYGLVERGRWTRAGAGSAPRRILFPFAAETFSQRWLDTALRLAQIDGATLVPVLLAAAVPGGPSPCEGQMDLLGAIERRGARFGVIVEPRAVHGHSYRDAVRELVPLHGFHTVFVASADGESTGLDPAEIGWLFQHGPREVFVTRRDQQLGSADR